MEAGKGEHKPYKILPTIFEDNAELQARKHYIGVDAVSWYINKKTSWFTKRMASGTLEIKLANGLEKYSAALGTFALQGGAKFAPIFQRPVLADRNFRGGSITFTVNLTAVKKNTTVGGLLQNAANVSLGIAAGMVETASLVGPGKLLSAASEELVNGVKSILNTPSDGHESIFDDHGLEITVQAEDVIGPSIYLLFHRGSPLEDSKLSVESHGELLMPMYNGTVLDDGAWLLIRIRRTDEYKNVRPWFDDARQLRGLIDDLVHDVSDGIIEVDKAINELSLSKSGDHTLFDKFISLRTIIRNDGVLTEREATSYVFQLRNLLNIAKIDIEKGKTEHDLRKEINDITNKIISGESLPDSVSFAMQEEASSLMEIRNKTLISSIHEKDFPDLSGTELLRTMQYVPNSFDLLANNVWG